MKGWHEVEIRQLPFFAMLCGNGYVPEMVHIFKKTERGVLRHDAKCEKIKDLKHLGTKVFVHGFPNPKLLIYPITKVLNNRA